MATPEQEGIGRTFPGDPNPPPQAPQAPQAPAAQPPLGAEPGEGPVTLAEEPTQPRAPRPIRATFQVAPDIDGQQSVYMTDHNLDTTRLGPVSVGNANALLSSVGQFNPKTKTWDISKETADQLMAGDLPFPEYLPAKYRQNKALIANGLIWNDWLKGDIDLEDAQGRGDLETIKMQLNEAPIFVWQGNLPDTAAKMWDDAKAAGVGGILRRTAGEAVGLSAFITDAPIVGAAGLTAAAAIVATKGLAAPAVATGLAVAMQGGAGFIVFKRSRDIEAGNAASDMMKKGFSEEQTRKWAPLIGIVSGALEVVSFRLLAAPFKRVVTRQILASPKFKQATAKAYRNYLLELGGEITVEEAQEATNLLAESIAAEAEGRPELAPTGEDIINAGANTFFQGLAGMGLLKAPGLGLEVATTQVAVRAEAKEAEAVSARLAAREAAPPTEAEVARPRIELEPDLPGQKIPEKSSDIIINPEIKDVKAQANDWLGREAAARGMVNDESFKRQFAASVHRDLNQITKEHSKRIMALPAKERQAALDAGIPADLEVAAKNLEAKFQSMQQAFPEIVAGLPKADPAAEAALLQGFREIQPAAKRVERPAAVTPETRIEAAIEELKTGQPKTAERVVKQADKILKEEDVAAEAAILEDVETAVRAEQRGARLERATRQVEAKARVKALQSELKNVEQRIQDATRVRNRFARRRQSTRALDSQINELLDQEEQIKQELTFFEAARERAAVTSGDILQIKPATLQNIVATGFREGRAEVIKTRSKQVKNLAAEHKLSETDIRKLLKAKNIGLMGDAAFRNFLKKFEADAKALGERKAALREVKAMQKDRQLIGERNLRAIYKLPNLAKMTTEQLQDYARLLGEFDTREQVMTAKRVKALERTGFAGILTYQKFLKKAADLLGRDVGDFRDVKVTELVPFMYDTLLAAQNPFFDLLVRAGKTAQIKGETLFQVWQETNRELAAAAIASRKKLLTLGERIADFLAPQQAALMEYIEETNAEKKTEMAAALTPEELEYADFLSQFARGAYQYMLKADEITTSRFVGAYVYHHGRQVSEMIRDLPTEGLVKTFKEFWKTIGERAERTSAIDKAGQALSFSKFMKQTMFRTGELTPSRNVVKSMEIYAKQFYEKVALDEMVPAIETLTRALQTLDKSPEAAQTNAKVLSFVKEFLNAKKGNVKWALDKGGVFDALIRTGSTWAALKFIALNIPLQLAAPVGEFAAQYVALGKKKILLAKIRKRTAQGKKILADHKGFIGEGVREQVFAPARSFQDKLGLAMYGSFRSNRIRTMEDLILGNMTKEEFAAGKLSPDRMAEIQIAAGRWIDIHGSKSMRGRTVEGAGWAQFKGWAIPPFTSIVQDSFELGRALAKLAKDPLNQGPKAAFTIGKTVITLGEGKGLPRLAVEMYRLAELGILVAFLTVATEEFEDDDSFVGRTVRYMVRELGSAFQAVSTVPSLTFGIWADMYNRMGRAVKMLILLEEFKTKPGLKGAAALKRELTPAAVKQFMADEKEAE